MSEFNLYYDKDKSYEHNRRKANHKKKMGCRLERTWRGFWDSDNVLLIEVEAGHLDVFVLWKLMKLHFW